MPEATLPSGFFQQPTAPQISQAPPSVVQSDSQPEAGTTPFLNTVRTALRGTILVFTLLNCTLRFIAVWFGAKLRGRNVTQMQRAEWMHYCGRATLSALGIAYRIEGNLPTGRTLIVANHLSYLDIAICSAALPCAFVAKHEIGTWPGFGPLSKMGGAIYVNRESRVSAWSAADRIHARLGDGVPVLVFPEGTSTDGSEVHRFHSPLLEPAIMHQIPVTPAAIFYEPGGETLTERDLCWFGDELFVPHLKRVLGIAGFRAVVRFGQPEIYPDRKAASWRAHAAVDQMRSRRR